MVKDLSRMTVPTSAAGLPIYFLNTLQTLSNDLDMMKGVSSDAVLSLQGFKKYPMDQKMLFAELLLLKRYLQNNSISFTPGESGYILLHIL